MGEDMILIDQRILLGKVLLEGLMCDCFAEIEKNYQWWIPWIVF
jgi:hypothetical protein